MAGVKLTTLHTIEQLMCYYLKSAIWLRVVKKLNFYIHESIPSIRNVKPYLLFIFNLQQKKLLHYILSDLIMTV